MFIIKTLVELFDICQVENVVAGLRFRPEEIIFVGYEEIMTEARTDALKKFFIKKGLNAKIYFEYAEKDNFQLMIDKFNYIIDNYSDCCFDLTGGEEQLLTAMGVVSAKRNAPMFQFDVESGDFINISGCEDMLISTPSFMTIKEVIELNGCVVLENEQGDVNWDFNTGFKKDIEKMWAISKIHCGSWNKQANALELLESQRTSGAGVEINDGTYLNKRIMKSLSQQGLIRGYPPENNILDICYKNSQIKKCLTKAGNIFELYSYLILTKITEENEGYYDDIDLSVYIDWDGKIHSDTDLRKDTKNEVDIMVMRDLIPIFISCKNGEVKKEALYELDTVAKKFGGKYARKYLFATYLSSDLESREYLKQRAKDMGITLIYNLHGKTENEIKRIFRKNVK